MMRLFARTSAVALVIVCSHAAPHAALRDQIEAVTQSIQREPGTAALFLRRGELYRQHRDWKAARADYEIVARLDPGNSDVILARARLAIDRGLLAETLSTLNRYLALQPNVEVALALRADVNNQLGHSSAAADDYAAALRVAAEPRVEYYLGRAAALANTGDDAGAVAAADAGIQRMGPLATLQQWSIEHLTRIGRIDEALARLDATLIGAARNETGLTRRAEILSAAGRRDEARDTFTSALAAWNALPERLRATRAMHDLRRRIDAGLESLAP